MGPSISKNVNDFQTTFNNNITQVSSLECLSSSQTDESGNAVIIQNSTILGNFTGLTVQTTADATCIMTSTMDNSIQNVIKDISQQTNSTDSGIFQGLSIQKNDTNVVETVNNNISQINQQLCESSNISVQDGNYLYVNSTFIAGDFIGISAGTNSKAGCSMTNYMKNSVFNQVQNSSTQSNTVTSVFSLILTIIILIIVVALLRPLITGGRK
jgi:hypothetical protein